MVILVTRSVEIVGDEVRPIDIALEIFVINAIIIISHHIQARRCPQLVAAVHHGAVGGFALFAQLVGLGDFLHGLIIDFANLFHSLTIGKCLLCACRQAETEQNH